MLKLHTMSDYTVISARPRRSRLANYAANVLAGIRDGGEMQARYEALSRMSNTELKSRGVTRDTVTQLILHGGAI
jgi:hypothetical protein